MKIQFQNFQGMRPRTSPEKLPENYAQVATDCDFRGGVLAAAKASELAHSIPKSGALRTLYKHGSRFLAFTGDVDVIESPIADADGRFAWTDGVKPMQSNDALAFASGYPEADWPAQVRRLGVPYPEDPPTVTLSGTAGDEVAWSGSYVYTFVTAWGEESANSYPTGTFDVYEGQTVSLSGFFLPDDDDLRIDKIRIYRAESGTSSASYEFVAEIEENTSSWTDTVTDLSGDILETETWIPAPDDMQGLVLTSSGIAAGFSGKQIYLSEPFIMYAYPESYRLTVDADIVGMGYANTTIFVLTEDHPYILSGVSPETMTQTKVSFPQSCVSKRSIVNIPGGVVYASPDGLAMLDGTGNVTLLTEEIYKKEQWNDLELEDLIGVYFDRKYYAFFFGSDSALVFDLDVSAVRTLDVGYVVYDALYDSVDDVIYALVYDDGDYKAVSVETGNAQAYTYRTRLNKTLMATNMSSARIIGNQTASAPVTFRLYCDDDLKHTETVTTDSPFRLPGGFRTKDIEVEVSGEPDIALIELATSISELTA